MPRPSLLAHADKLDTLRVLVEIGSFRGAAARLAVTPSSVSQAIATLERYLGEQLVVRGQTVSATPHAVHLLGAVGPALEAIRDVERPASPALPKAKLRLGAYESLAVSVVPDLLGHLRAKHPALTVTIRTGRSGLLAQLVRRGDLDSALVVENDVVGRLDVKVLAHDDLGLWASPAHPVFRAGVAREMPYAGLAPGADGLPRFYRGFLRAMGVNARPFIECDSFEVLRMMAVRQVAVAVLPRRVALRAPGELRALPGPRGATGNLGRHALCLVSRPGVNARVRDVLADELGTLLAGP
jgi:DNA-binding transcriptional LysR family regulator